MQLRLEGPKVQLSKEAGRAGPPHTVLCGPGECKSHPRQFPWLLVKGQDLRRDWALGEKVAYPREGIQGLNGFQAHEEAKHSCPSEEGPSDGGGQNEAEYHPKETMHSSQLRKNTSINIRWNQEAVDTISSPST